MTKQKAIKAFCDDCSGGAYKDLVLCTGTACPLWPYRLGTSTKSTRYREAVESIFKRYPADVAELASYHLTPEDFLPARPSRVPVKRTGRAARGGVGQRAGESSF